MTPIYIPVDLQFNILLRLPVKSILRFRCVSKLWSSIITSGDFRNPHLNISASSAPSHLLIAFEDFHGEELLLVSLPNPNASSSSSSSSCRVPYSDLSLVNLKGKSVCNVVRGLICVTDGNDDVGIYNPTTSQLHNFPQRKVKDDPERLTRPKYVFGYDPVEDQYKVLAVDHLTEREEHKVVVLGGKEAWREAPCSFAFSRNFYTRGLYMNGTMYYGAIMTKFYISVIVSFDVRFGTFNVIEVPSKVQSMGRPNMWVATPWWFFKDKTLINYGGKIGVVENPHEGRFRMWVVEDDEKEKWSINTFHLPESAASLNLKVTDSFSMGEICLVPEELSDPFHLFYYNLDERSMRCVIIEGLPISKLKLVEKLSVTVSDHYENFMS